MADPLVLASKVGWLRSLGYQMPGLLGTIIVVALFLYHIQTVAAGTLDALNRVNQALTTNAIALEQLAEQGRAAIPARNEEHRSLERAIERCCPDRRGG